MTEVANPMKASTEASPAPAEPAAATAPPEKTSMQVNGKPYFPDGDPEMPLLWYLRDTLRLTGTKYGCGIGACGACTVLIDGKAARACQVPLRAAAGHDITTIEGLEGGEGKPLHPVQQAWIEHDVAQCGYCQSGQILAAVDLLSRRKTPSDDDIASIGNLCRCGTYPRIRSAIQRAAVLMAEQSS
jgi:isoquinoline 1-oxidoreductase alpha subunit